MIHTFRSYKVFISSPSDVIAERNITESVITKIDRICRETFEISLEVKRWENLSPVTPYTPEQKIQDIIDMEVKNSTFFILVLNKRYGTIEPGHTISNTEREINTILARFEKNKAIKILSYFKKNPPNSDSGKQEKKVLELKTRLDKLGIFYKEYETEEEFKDYLTHAIYDVVLRMQLSPYKKLQLRKFWQLGKLEGSAHPEVVIIYPPVSRESMKPLEVTDFWLGRLQPNVFFEDYKGLYKVHKCLSLIGFHNSKIYPDTDMPNNLERVNRIWVCLPRLPKAVQYLNRYAHVAKFKFHPRSKGSVGFIEWHPNTKKKIKVTSPLNIYLEEQRKTMDYTKEWNSQLGKIFAKDYAIFARFKDTRDDSPDSDGSLHDYFFAGIRGLGTWGSTWYLDRQYNKLTNADEDSDIQILLEVTYENGRIAEVKDVSSEPAAYFKKENSIDTIRDRINEFNKREHK